MQTIEQIIRPFQSPATLPKRRIVSTNTKISVGVAEIEWGQAGELPAPEKREFDDEGGIAFTVLKCDDQFGEKERKFNVVRIENPVDPAQFVMVERINQIKFDKKNEPNNMTMYNNSTTSFVTLPALDNTLYWKSNHEQQKCQSTFNLTYPRG